MLLESLCNTKYNGARCRSNGRSGFEKIEFEIFYEKLQS